MLIFIKKHNDYRCFYKNVGGFIFGEPYFAGKYIINIERYMCFVELY
jgi:hypothetical protein